MMAFALRMNFVDVVVDHSLRNETLGGEVLGFSFDIRLSYYRGQFLSVIDELTVTVDGVQVPDEKVRFRLNGKDFGVRQLGACTSEWWDILTPANIFIHQPGGLAAGEHEIKLRLMFRSPYMPIGPDYQYMPVDSSGEKTLALEIQGG